MNRFAHRNRSLGILGAASPLELPSIETMPSVIDTSSLPSGLPSGLTVPVTSAPPSPPSRGYDVAQLEAVPATKLENGSLVWLLAPESTQLPPGKADPRTLLVQRHVNHFLNAYNYQPIPEDGVFGPKLCGAFYLLDVENSNIPDEHIDPLRTLGLLHDLGMGYRALFGMAGTNGSIPGGSGCDVELPELKATKTPPKLPATPAPSIDMLVDAARQEVITRPRIDPTQSPTATGWGTLTLPPGSPIPAVTAGGTTPTKPDGTPLPSIEVPTFPGGRPVPVIKPPDPKKPEEKKAVAASGVSATTVVLVGLGAVALAALLLGGKKKRS
jgi:hypothetical protein